MVVLKKSGADLSKNTLFQILKYSFTYKNQCLSEKKIINNIQFFMNSLVTNSLGILSTKSTIYQKLRIGELSQAYINLFQNIAQILGQEKNREFSIYFNNLTITPKIEIGKIEKLIFHSFQAIAHILCKYSHS